jgi:dolichyl-diphosphooligosaccharide--protein glycosyltransferase
MASYVYKLAYLSGALYLAYVLALEAYRIRLNAIHEYGAVIHEFDPWFNFRATQYLYDNGWRKFFTWFDYKVWYPLGRPVGTTIYPGMQFTAVFLKRYFPLTRSMSLNDVCCYMPAWFGAIASIVTGLLAYECSRKDNSNTNVLSVLLDIVIPSRSNKAPPTPSGGSPALEVGLVTMAVMAILPAHLMRSVGGGYDNESVAITAMTLTFYLWTRSLRASDKYSHWWGILAGVAYFNMAAAWGGYVFVLNMVGLHAAFLVAMGRFSPKIYKAYTFFYIVGTALAVQIPVIGFTPLKSLEQLGPCAVFLVYQVLYFSQVVSRKRSLTRMESLKLTIQYFAVAVVVLVITAHFLAPKGYFGPVSSRVRGLFVKHTRTGNPLVDSVAEHQPASNTAYFQYLHYVMYTAPVGFLFLLWNFGDASSFLMVYAVAAYFFSAKMVRLIILLGPIASCLTGVVLGRSLHWCLTQYLPWLKEAGSDDITSSEQSESSEPKKKKTSPGTSSSKKENGSKSKSSFAPIFEAIDQASKSSEGMIIKKAIAVVCVAALFAPSKRFYGYCWEMSKALSHPAIMFKAQTRTGEVVLVDDYREAYFWLRDNTPEDARIMAWWDYGYQITGIANRTTIADGNTWNHEHIALLGKILTSSEKEGHRIARHLADYVLVWAGGGGDDLAKSPHLARIANSVYRGHCPNDVTCRQFGFTDNAGTPSAMMAASFLFKLHSHNLHPGIQVDPNRFREVFRSKYGKVRIYKVLGVSQESKEWVANPANRICDVEGGWFCRGQYPPALQEVLRSKKDFSQLEDFNKKVKDEEDDEYLKQYFEDLANPENAKKRAQKSEEQRRRQQESSSKKDVNPPSRSKARKLSPEEIAEIYNTYVDSEDTTRMWKLISTNNVEEISDWLEYDPKMAFLRSADGRGPMWWAYEFRNEPIVKLLIKHGVSYKDVDKYGKTPLDMLGN